MVGFDERENVERGDLGPKQFAAAAVVLSFSTFAFTLSGSVRILSRSSAVGSCVLGRRRHQKPDNRQGLGQTSNDGSRMIHGMRFLISPRAISEATRS